MEAFKSIYLQWHGRCSRESYWIYSYPILLLWFVFIYFQGSLIEDLLIFSLVVAIYPMVMLHVRRAHDRGKSGWFCLIFFIPIVCLWPVIELVMLKGEEVVNKYGEPTSDSKIYDARGQLTPLALSGMLACLSIILHAAMLGVVDSSKELYQGLNTDQFTLTELIFDNQFVYLIYPVICSLMLVYGLLGGKLARRVCYLVLTVLVFLFIGFLGVVFYPFYSLQA